MHIDAMKELDMLPLNGMVICEEVKIEGSTIVLPDNSGLKTGFSMLRVIKKAKDCKEVQIGDLIILMSLPKRFGKFSVADEDYFMSKEEEIGVILR